MSNKHGNLSISSDNIFPIIKKWMYSDHDIFYRELISNGCDAVTKLKKPGSNYIERIFNYKYPYEYNARFDTLMERKKRISEFYSEIFGSQSSADK